MKDRGKPVYYYAVFTLINGGFGFDVMTKEEINVHKNKYSQAAGSKYSPWSTNFDDMAKKTVLKRVLKYAPIRTEFARKINNDETIKTELSEDMSDVMPEETEAYVVDEDGVVLENEGSIENEQSGTEPEIPGQQMLEV